MATDILLHFGRHNGTYLSDCPDNYIRWLSEQGTICGRKDIPLAAKKLLAERAATTQATSTPVASSEKKLARTVTARQIDRLRFLQSGSDADRETRRQMLALRDHNKLIKVVDRCGAEESWSLAYVKDDGTVYGASPYVLDFLKIRTPEGVRALLTEYGMEKDEAYFMKQFAFMMDMIS